MATRETPLPWEALRVTEGELPWPALEQFADVVAAGASSVIEDLEKLYDESWEVALDTPTYAYLYVPAIFALAAPRLSRERKSDIAAFLVRKLVEAGREDEDLSMEILEVACGTLGPACVPHVLNALAAEKDSSGAWFHLWTLTRLAAKADDGALRDRTIRACMELMQQADQGPLEPLVVIGAAMTLALLGHTQCRPVLERLISKDSMFGRADLQEALDRLDGDSGSSFREPWEEPVREWFEPRWQTAKDWFEHADEEDGDWGEEDDEREAQRADDLARRFERSPFAAELPEPYRKYTSWIAFNLLYYAHAHTGTQPEDLDRGALEEVLLEVFPRKVSAERDLFESVAPVTQAFLRWLESEGILRNSAELADTVGKWAGDIIANAMDPKNWGMAKGVTMQARAGGVDPSDPDAMNRFILDCNLRIQQRVARKEVADEEEPAIDQRYQSEAPRIGRNDPCPCGSGKKYKKCCGRK